MAAVAALDDAAETQRFIVLRGETGVGKSWVLRHYSERVAARAPIIVLDDRISTALGGMHAVEVGALSDEEVAILADQAPELRMLLDASHPAAQLARNLYRLSRLLREPSAASVRTEAGLAQLWWISADGAPAAEVRAAQRILEALAIAALKGDARIDLAEDSPARDHLLGAQSLREVRRDRLDFHHDVLRD